MLNKAPQRLTSKSIAEMARTFQRAPVQAPEAIVAPVAVVPAPEVTAPMPKPVVLAPAPAPMMFDPSVALSAKQAISTLQRGDWARLSSLEAAGVITEEDAKRIGLSWVGQVEAVRS